MSMHHATPNNKLNVADPNFWNEEALLKEERRQFDVCHGCRLCESYCPVFPELFRRTDSLDGDFSKLTRADLRKTEDLCYQCKLCYFRCPYIAPHQYDMDIPRLMIRANLVNTKKDGLSLIDRVIGDTDLLGKVGGLTAPLANWGNQAAPVRFVMEKTAGIHRDAVLPRMHTQSFASWFKRNGAALNKGKIGQRKVAIFYTCSVNYNAPAIGIAAAQVLAHNGIALMVPKQQCCGMPFMDGGALDLALKKIRANVASLAQVVRDGYEIVVLTPTSSFMIKNEYPQLEPTADCRLVAEHTFDVSEYLWKLKGEGALKTDFKVRLGKIAYHVPCHTRVQFIGFRGADLLALVPGAEVERIERCSAHDGTWGVKVATHALSMRYGAKLFDALKDSDAELYTSDCPLAANHIELGTGQRPIHPLQVLKTAYGL